MGQFSSVMLAQNNKVHALFVIVMVVCFMRKRLLMFIFVVSFSILVSSFLTLVTGQPDCSYYVGQDSPEQRHDSPPPQ